MNNREKYKIIYDNLTKSLVLVERDRKVEQDFNFSPKAFAQKFFYKLGEQVEKGEIEEIVKNRTLKRKMLFKQGDCEADEEKGNDENIENLRMRNLQFQQPPMPPQNPPFPNQQQPVELSRNIYNKLNILNMLYQDLQNFNTSYNEQFRDMISELRIITFAMLRIYQDLSGRQNVPIQNQRKPNFGSFYQGVVVTSNYLRSIMFDVRNLQRMVDVQNIDRQLIIINFTLQAQQSQLQQMRQDCIEGGQL